MRKQRLEITKRLIAAFYLLSVPGVGLEPTRRFTLPRGLSPLRLPFRHPGLPTR